MSMPTLTFNGPSLELFSRADAAIAQIPPAFPLSATIAVNPYLGQAGEPRALTSARLAAVAGERLFRPRDDLAAMVQEGRVTPEDLDQAAQSVGAEITVEDLAVALRRPAPEPKALPHVAALADDASGIGWSAFVEERIGTWAAAHFDQGQAFWPAPDSGVYASWRAFASRDLTPGIAGLSGFAHDVADLPDDPRAGFAAVCTALGLEAAAAELYFHRLLMSMGGWAQYARHLGWIAERDGERNTATFELLTIRLIWEALLYKRFAPQISDAWQEALASYATPLAPSREDLIDAALQEAADRAAERALAERFEAGPGETQSDASPAIQAAFCIDVRSEVFRRALEAEDEGIRTIGFAGFFGLAVTHRAMASDTPEARAPILLNPAVSACTHSEAGADEALRIDRRALRAWGRFKMAAVSAFAFVEAAAPLYIGKLVRDSIAHETTGTAEPAPGVDLPLADRIGAAKTILGAMSLTSGFARLVLVAGHGSHVTNAPHASALQCGACGGYAGDVNARLLTGLLNDADVRAGLRDAGITVPDDTHFIAGLHDTVTDRVTLYDDQPSAAHRDDVARLKSALSRAARATRLERAMRLPRAENDHEMLLRGFDWAELRPEWGLAGCAAFIAAPRQRSRGQDLGGRAFLHDYDWKADEGFGVLELILTAPVVVASWISLQYHGSSIAPGSFGAGNKLLHNVTGGIGVVEGNGGLLRAGLPMQSVHDGETLRHEPLRLTVVVEAPQAAITDILARHAGVRDLFDNGWLALITMDSEGRIAARYEAGTWHAVSPRVTNPERSAA